MCNIDESEIELKFHDLCRLCASYKSNRISLFGDDGKRRQLKKKIQYCFPFKVDENDALPKSLCLACVESLENTFQFREKCVQVNRSLEKYLSKKEKEKQEKTNSSQSHRIRPEVSIFAIPPTGQTSSNQNANEASSLPTDSEDGPNPLDFLEVGVNAEDNVPNANTRTVSESDTKPSTPPGTPPSTQDTTDEKLDSSLPPQSRERYLALYETFIAWLKSREEWSFSEDSLMTYFLEISEKFKPSTLWAQYSMLKATINCNHGIDIGRYSELLSFLKKKSDGFTSTKAKVLTSEEVERFLTEAPDREFLAIKVALIFGISGSCKTDELTAMTIDNIEHHGQLLLVRIPPSKSKPARSFTIDGEFYNIVKRYEALRPARAETKRFFLNYQRGKCTTQVIGKNKFSSMPKRIAEYLKLPDPKHYTGHSLSRTSTSLVTNIGGDLMTIKRHNAWKATIKSSRSLSSSALAVKSECEPTPTSSLFSACEPAPSASCSTTDSDCGPTMVKRQKVEDPLSSNVKVEPPQVATDTESEFNELVQYVEHEETVVMPEINRPITFKNCSNVTINFIRQNPADMQTDPS